MQTITQVSATNNQSNAVYQQKKIFIWENRYVEALFTNGTGATVTLVAGTLVLRDTAVAKGIKLAVAGSTLADTVGILAVEGTQDVPAGGTALVNYCAEGGIDGTQLTLPGGVTLDTVVGTKTVEDIINALGMHVDRSAVENTKQDN
jgi:hypothetical protein